MTGGRQFPIDRSRSSPTTSLIYRLQIVRQRNQIHFLSIAGLAEETPTNYQRQSIFTQSHCCVTGATSYRSYVDITSRKGHRAIQKPRFRLDADIFIAFRRRKEDTKKQLRVWSISLFRSTVSIAWCKSSAGLCIVLPFTRRSTHIATRQTQLARFVPSPDVNVSRVTKGTTVPSTSSNLDDFYPTKNLNFFWLLNWFDGTVT